MHFFCILIDTLNQLLVSLFDIFDILITFKNEKTIKDRNKILFDNI